MTAHITIPAVYRCRECGVEETFPIVPYMPSGPAKCRCGGRMKKRD